MLSRKVVWPTDQGKEDILNLLIILIFLRISEKNEFLQFEKGQIQVVALGEVAERLLNSSSCQDIHFANFLM